MGFIFLLFGPLACVTVPACLFDQWRAQKTTSGSCATVKLTLRKANVRLCSRLLTQSSTEPPTPPPNTDVYRLMNGRSIAEGPVTKAKNPTFDWL